MLFGKYPNVDLPLAEQIRQLNTYYYLVFSAFLLIFKYLNSLNTLQKRAYMMRLSSTAPLLLYVNVSISNV